MAARVRDQALIPSRKLFLGRYKTWPWSHVYIYSLNVACVTSTWINLDPTKPLLLTTTIRS